MEIQTFSTIFSELCGCVWLGCLTPSPKPSNHPQSSNFHKQLRIYPFFFLPAQITK